VNISAIGAIRIFWANGVTSPDRITAVMLVSVRHIDLTSAKILNKNNYKYIANNC
jgi:hypothetical protein